MFTPLQKIHLIKKHEHQVDVTNFGKIDHN